MNFSEPFIRRPVMTLLLSVTTIIFGILAYRSLPVNDLPTVDFPVISVGVGYPGASPETMAATVATPLERQFLQINGVDLITSTSTQGFTQLSLQFNLSKSIDSAATDVQASIQQALSALPADLPSPPTLSKQNPNEQPILFIALTSETLTYAQIYDFANTLVAQRISILPGVSKVDLFGSKGAIRVKADPSKLAIRALTMEDLANAIRAGTSYQGAGQFDGPNRTFLLQPQGQLETAEDYQRLVIAERDGNVIRLGDVATVSESISDERFARIFNVRGQPTPASSITLAVSRAPGSNTVAVARSVRELLPQLKRELPGSIDLIPTYDRSATIVASVNDVQETLFIAFILVVVVIFVFLGRAADTLIPVVALPMSLFITFIVMQRLNYSIDNLSLLALTLAIGFLVDDAIVFLENCVRRMEHLQEPPIQAALASAKEISFTIISMTLSLAAVFLPLVFMPGVLGLQFREFAIVIIVAIVASGVVSLTLTPLMCSTLLHGHLSGSKTWMERKMSVFMDRVIAGYGRTLDIALRHRLVSVVAFVLCLVATYVLFGLQRVGFLPVGDSGFARGVIRCAEGTSPEQLRGYLSQIEKIVKEHPAVDKSLVRTQGFDVFTVIFLRDRKERAPIQRVIREIITEINKIPGVAAFISPNAVLQISTGAAGNAQGKFSYTITGLDGNEVRRSTEELTAKLRSYPGFLFVNNDLQTNTPNLSIEILREPAATYGVSAQRILSALRNAYSQNFVYLIKKANDQYQVILEVDDQQRSVPENLKLLFVRADDNKTLVPLSAVARWTEVVGPRSVQHLNQFPCATISFNLKEGEAIGDAAAFVEKTAAAVLPPTVTGSPQGESKVFAETVGALGVLMIAAVFAMYVILGILYESYVHPLTVLSSLPVAAVGGLATLLIFDQECSLYAFVGIFLLLGIVKKNGIMMIDFAIQRMAEGVGAEKAVHEASLERFRPIIMTTLAALMGAVPLALGWGADGEARRPLGLVIVGGLIVSQIITLYITPVLFLYGEKFQAWLDTIPFFRRGSAPGVQAPASAGEPASA
ncbi:MAG: efflux RND transporter permease subunit [Verrucomicrobia bacterium]|nr:efflux RND transporter permease subunit [Verrucomicrobiota bacterium]